jgi:hypothetical protein
MMELGLAHHAGQPQEQSVVIGAWIIDALGVRDQRAKHRAELEQLIPIAVVARQTRGVKGRPGNLTILTRRYVHTTIEVPRFGRISGENGRKRPPAEHRTVFS